MDLQRVTSALPLLCCCRLPQAAALAAAARDEDAGGAGGLAHMLKFACLHALQDIGSVTSNAVHQVLLAITALHLLLVRQFLAAAGAGHLPKVIEGHGRFRQPLHAADALLGVTPVLPALARDDLSTNGMNISAELY
jgi:hypothetical protein